MEHLLQEVRRAAAGCQAVASELARRGSEPTPMTLPEDVSMMAFVAQIVTGLDGIVDALGTDIALHRDAQIVKPESSEHAELASKAEEAIVTASATLTATAFVVQIAVERTNAFIAGECCP